MRRACVWWISTPGVPARSRKTLDGSFGKLGSVEIDPHVDAAIGRAGERLDHRPVDQNICRSVDFFPRAIDQRYVYMLEVFGRRI
ncbi:MAG TPA: hypothetical protein VMU78_08245 [Methylocella sp.]|nr:hypothetical protein [Methylocella sp.]